jgi:hypothetical protein
MNENYGPLLIGTVLIIILGFIMLFSLGTMTLAQSQITEGGSSNNMTGRGENITGDAENMTQTEATPINQTLPGIPG